MSAFSLRQSTKYNVHVGATAPGRPFPPPSIAAKITAYLGEVAQLGERRVRNAEVGSSILLFSTIPFKIRIQKRLPLAVGSAD
jgi:hypothetical protein